MSVILAIDYGRSRIGLAISDPLGIAANPLESIKRKSDRQVVEAIERVIRERNVEIVVIGLPLNMDGSEGPMAMEVRQFAVGIEALGVRIELWDERLSTRAAEAMLIQADLTRKKRKTVRDKVAAAWFLQAYLDLQANKQRKGET